MAKPSVTDLIADIGLDMKELAKRMRYASENSVRQWRDGKAQPSDEQYDWLRRYARFRVRQREADANWIESNPPPPGPRPKARRPTRACQRREVALQA